MAIKIQTVDESIEHNGMKCLVHGPSGSGKTVLCATAIAKTLMLSAEAGLRSWQDIPAEIKAFIDVVVINDITDLQEAYTYAEKNEPGYVWVCLDSITEIAEQVLSAERRLVKDPRQAYGSMADNMVALLKGYRDLPYINVLMTCKQEYTKDGTGLMSYRPMFPGRVLPQGVSYLFDEVFAIRVMDDDDGEPFHVLQCQRDIQYDAKDRSGRLDRFERPHLGALLEKMIGEKEEMNGDSAPEAPTEEHNESEVADTAATTDEAGEGSGQASAG